MRPAWTYNLLMLPRPDLEFAARTDTGMVRSHNEDAIHASPEHAFAVLADGMGGYNAGEVASAMAVDAVRLRLQAGLSGLSDRRRDAQVLQLLNASIHEANKAILAASEADADCRGMGTTIVAAVFDEDRLTLAHVGDSRAYRLRGEALVQITKDHSLVQEQIDAGLVDPASAAYALHRNLVTRAVGVDPEMEVELHAHSVQAGDVYLLCSDGLSDMLDIDAIGRILQEHPASLEAACEALVAEANAKGGHDNISVILIRVQSLSPQAGGVLSRMLRWIG